MQSLGDFQARQRSPHSSRASISARACSPGMIIHIPPSSGYSRYSGSGRTSGIGSTFEISISSGAVSSPGGVRGLLPLLISSVEYLCSHARSNRVDDAEDFFRVDAEDFFRVDAEDFFRVDALWLPEIVSAPASNF